MINSLDLDSIKEAVILAVSFHTNDTRKVTGNPFIIHPMMVMSIVGQFTNSHIVKEAAILHDVLDQAKTAVVYDSRLRAIKGIFGPEVTNLILAVSDDRKHRFGVTGEASWLERKQAYMNRLLDSDQKVCYIVGADKIDNLNSLIQLYDVVGEKVWQYFKADRQQMTWYYKQVAEILADKSPAIGLSLKRLIKKAEQSVFHQPLFKKQIMMSNN